MPRPRVGVDFHTWDGIHQGTRSHILGLYSAAVDMAEDIDFFFFADDISALKREWDIANRKNVFFLRMPTRSGISRLLFQLPGLIIRHKLNILHVQYRIPPIHLGRCVVTIHDVLFETHPQYFTPIFNLLMRSHSRFSARNARRTFTVSDYSRKEIIKCYGVDEMQIALTPNGVDLCRFSTTMTAKDMAILTAHGLQSNQFVLSVGRLEPRKNYKTLIAAYIMAGFKNIPLVIVGQRDFRYTELLTQVQEARSLGYTILILEDIDNNTLPILMRHCALFAYLSFAEGFGMPPLEAIACGARILASDCTAIPEVVGGTGTLVPPTNTRMVAEALKKLLITPTLHNDCNSQRHKKIDQYSWKNSAFILVGEYRKLLKAVEC